MSLADLRSNQSAVYQVVSHNDQDYLYGTGIGVWRDLKTRSVYILATTPQVDPEYEHFVVDSLDKTHCAKLIVYDRHSRMAILRVSNAPATFGVVRPTALRRPKTGQEVYIISWRYQTDAAAITTGIVSSPSFTMDGVHDDIYISSPDFSVNDDDVDKTKYGGAVFNKDTGALVGMLHWTHFGTMFGVIPAEQIARALLSIQYEIRPSEEWCGLDPCATNDYFLGLFGHRFHPARVNYIQPDHPALAGRGNIGIRVKYVLTNSPADDAGISDDNSYSTYIWAVSAVEDASPSQWKLISEDSSMETILQELFPPRKRSLRNTLSSSELQMSYPNETVTVYLLTSRLNNPNDFDVKTVTLPKARAFFNNYGNTNELNNFLKRDWYKGGYGNQYSDNNY